MRKVLIDAHTHTVASGHAYSSLQEMAKAAADMELEVLGITEHGPSVPGTCPTLYFKNMFTVPRQMYGIRLLMGCEINILDTKGSLDLTDEQIGWLDLAIAGIHAAWYQGGTKDENTEGMIRVIKNPKIHIISHPGDGSAEMDFEQLVLAAKEAHTLLEVNNHSLAPQRKKTVARDNNLEILRLCKKYDVPTILGSDAHISFQIADYERLYPLLVETDFPDELIMNYWPDKFFDYLGILDDTDHPLRVLLLRATLIPRSVNARNGKVEPPNLLIRQVKTAFRIENVDFAAHQQPYAIHLARHGEHILEIQRRTRAWHTRPMLSDTQHFQSHVGSSLRHFLQATVCMS